MFYEYALDPAVISSWERARFFLDAFGPWKGRFLAEYPKHWRRLVYQGLACPEIEKKRIEERLSQLDRRIFSARRGAPYDGSQTWLDNANTEHAHEAFRAIISASSASKAYIIDASEVDERNTLWRADGGRIVEREAVVFAEMLRLLLVASKRVLIIDPYFRADQRDKVAPLAAFCKLVRATSDIEVHFAEAPRSYSQCMTDALRVLPRELPDGAKVRLCCWKERPGGARLHNRYLITEVGGVKFGDGIEVGSKGHQDHVSILDEPSRAALWEQYVGATPMFDPAGAHQDFVGTRRAAPADSRKSDQRAATKPTRARRGDE